MPPGTGAFCFVKLSFILISVTTKSSKPWKAFFLLLMCGTLLFVGSGNAKAQNWNDFLNDIKEGSPESAENLTDIESLAGLGINFFLGLAVAISFIALILSGIKYMSARGDVKATMGAKQALTYSLVAIMLTVGAFALQGLILDVLGVDTGDRQFVFPAPPEQGVPIGPPPITPAPPQ